jgi:transcriptional regulator with XRE-family HTH domain
MDIRNRFGNALKRLRKQQGLSQEQLAIEAGLDRSYIGGVERGERNISLINIEKLAKTLDIPIHILFMEIDDSEEIEK